MFRKYGGDLPPLLSCSVMLEASMAFRPEL